MHIKLDRLLFTRIDNSPLIVFRVFFGSLIFLESVGAIFTGWVKRVLIDPEFTFTFIGFEWLQPLPGIGMYFYYAIMGIFGLFVMVGYRYRISALAFTIMWTVTYLMQKTSYNNHYYLLILVSGIMALLPAERYLSLDCKRKPEIRSIHMPHWVSVVIILQLFIVYTYAAIAKLYPDWLDFTVVRQILEQRKYYYVVGELLQQHAFHVFITYAGIAFDFLVIPLLLWKPTRKWAFLASIFFHLFNSIVLQIGIFPYLSLAFTVFFFEPKTIRNIFLRQKPLYQGDEIRVSRYKRWMYALIAVYFSIQVLLPLRHHMWEDDVLWTEEGHRMSWRMMLRSKRGYLVYQVVNKDSGDKTIIKPKDRLTPKQAYRLTYQPDFIWQFAQRLKEEYREKSLDVAIYVQGKASVNGHPYQTLIDPEVDLGAEPWLHLRHHHWIMPSRKE